MTTLEDLVRDAQQRQAGRAVPAERILPGLSERIARHRRRRRATASAGAAAVAAVVALSAPQLLRAPAPAPAPVAPAPVPSSSPSAVTETPAFPLSYRPTWMPLGFREFHRVANTEEGPVLDRIWRRSIGPGDTGNGPSLTLQIRRVPPGEPGSGVYDYLGPQGDQKSSITWKVDDRTRLTVSAGRLTISRQDMLRIARSVVPDPGTFEPPVQVRWLPEDWSTTGISVSGPEPARWRSETFVSAPDTSVQVIVGTVTEAPAGGEELTVNGRPARAPKRTDRPGQSLAYLVVDMGGGRLMTLIGDGGATMLNTLILIADRVDLTPAGATWLGARL